MDVNKTKPNIMPPDSMGGGGLMPINTAFDFLAQIPQRLQGCLKLNPFQHQESGTKDNASSLALPSKKEKLIAHNVNLAKQLQKWKENSNWIDDLPDIEVSVPKGSLCNLNVKFKVGLPPDAIFNIVTDPDNKRVFKNIKEVISRKVLVDEGLRQVVEVEQAAIWRFLWWSGTISVHVNVDQDRRNHTVKFKQGKLGFMKKFEGCWTIQPLFIDEDICYPHKPKNLDEYESCTGGRGRVGSIVSLEQLVQLAIVPPPPISWYVRNITRRTIEMLLTDLLAEAARLRGSSDVVPSGIEPEEEIIKGSGMPVLYHDAIKERWGRRKR